MRKYSFVSNYTAKQYKFNCGYLSPKINIIQETLENNASFKKWNQINLPEFNLYFLLK